MQATPIPSPCEELATARADPQFWSQDRSAQGHVGSWYALCKHLKSGALAQRPQPSYFVQLKNVTPTTKLLMGVLCLEWCPVMQQKTCSGLAKLSSAQVVCQERPVGNQRCAPPSQGPQQHDRQHACDALLTHALNCQWVDIHVNAVGVMHAVHRPTQSPFRNQNICVTAKAGQKHAWMQATMELTGKASTAKR
jgi:hypothetical protein